MLKTFWKFALITLLVLPSILLLIGNGQNGRCLVSAQDPDLDDDGQVETEEPDIGDALGASDTLATQDEEDDDEDEKPLKPSPDADTYILFTRPNSFDLPAGQLVEFLVGFSNKGSQDFILETLDASFRYPMDFSFYIQNFSTIHYNRVVKPKQQVTLGYTFIPNEAFSSRPFGLTVNLFYRDAAGSMFLDAIFNSTVNIVEIDEGLDGETFFLYIFLAACVVLLLVAGQQFLASFGRKRPIKKQQIEMGTSNPNDVDYDWLPKETLSELNKSPQRSTRQRRAKRSTGADE